MSLLSSAHGTERSSVSSRPYAPGTPSSGAPNVQNRMRATVPISSSSPQINRLAVSSFSQPRPSSAASKSRSSGASRRFCFKVLESRNVERVPSAPNKPLIRSDTSLPPLPNKLATRTFGAPSASLGRILPSTFAALLRFDPRFRRRPRTETKLFRMLENSPIAISARRQPPKLIYSLF